MIAILITQANVPPHHLTISLLLLHFTCPSHHATLTKVVKNVCDKHKLARIEMNDINIHKELGTL